MVVTNHEVDTKRRSIFNFFDGLNSTVQCNNELETILSCEINPLNRNTVTFVIPIGDVKIYVIMKLLQELIYQRDRSSSINVVISIDQDLFIMTHGFCKSFYSFVHIGH